MPQEYKVSITDVVWRGKPASVILRTPEGQRVAFHRGEVESVSMFLSEERAQEIRGNGYVVEPPDPEPTEPEGEDEAAEEQKPTKKGKKKKGKKDAEEESESPPNNPVQPEGEE